MGFNNTDSPPRVSPFKTLPGQDILTDDLIAVQRALATANFYTPQAGGGGLVIHSGTGGGYDNAGLESPGSYDMRSASPTRYYEIPLVWHADVASWTLWLHPVVAATQNVTVSAVLEQGQEVNATTVTWSTVAANGVILTVNRQTGSLTLSTAGAIRRLQRIYLTVSHGAASYLRWYGVSANFMIGANIPDPVFT